MDAIEGSQEKGELLLNFAGDRYRFNRIPARAVIAGAKQDFWATRAPVRDKIVLVGGAFAPRGTSTRRRWAECTASS